MSQDAHDRDPFSGGGPFLDRGIAIAAVKDNRVLVIAERAESAQALGTLDIAATTLVDWSPETVAAAGEQIAGSTVVLVPERSGNLDGFVDACRGLLTYGIQLKQIDAARFAGGVRRWAASGVSKIDVEQLVAAARPIGPKSPRDKVAAAALALPSISECVARPISAFTEERVEWLWDGRVPLGKPTVIEGDPGLGKSTLTLDLAARVSRGVTLPLSRRRQVARDVLLLSAEDAPSDTIRPRLAVAGADLDRVHFLEGQRNTETGIMRPTVLPGDIPQIEEQVRRIGAALVVIDPFVAFLDSGLNAYRDQDVRHALHPLSQMARRTGAAVVLVRHLNKRSGDAAMYRGGGSIGITGAARSVLVVALDPDDETGIRRVVASQKSNLGPRPPGAVFQLAPRSKGTCVVVQWVGESAQTAAELLSADNDPHNRSMVDEAVEFLSDFLADGPKPAKEIFKQGGEAGHREKTLRRAKTKLGIGRPDKSGPVWVWKLPNQDGQAS